MPVYDVEAVDDAVRIAIARTGERLNPDLSYVDIEMGSRTSPDGEALPPAFVAADEALVALELEMTVFNVESPEHADRIARTEIGKRLEGVPLKVLDTERVPDGADDCDATHDDETETGEAGSKEGDAGETTNAKDDEADESAQPADGEAGTSGDGNDGESEGNEEADGETEGEAENRETEGEDENRERAGDLLPAFEELVGENRR